MNNTTENIIANAAVTYRVNIYFSNGKSLGFVNIYMDDENTTDETTLQIKKLIKAAMPILSPLDFLLFILKYLP